jgi:hypothetical protein
LDAFDVDGFAATVDVFSDDFDVWIVDVGGFAGVLFRSTFFTVDGLVIAIFRGIIDFDESRCVGADCGFSVARDALRLEVNGRSGTDRVLCDDNGFRAGTEGRTVVAFIDG